MTYIKWLPCFIFPSISLLFKLYYRQENENLEDVKLHLIDTLKVSLSPKAKKANFMRQHYILQTDIK